MNQIAKMTKQIDEATEDAQNHMLQQISCQIERLSPIGSVEERASPIGWIQYRCIASQCKGPPVPTTSMFGLEHTENYKTKQRQM